MEPVRKPSGISTFVGFSAILALPFLWRLAYEATVLRQEQGPQNLLFSLLHGALPAVLTIPILVGFLVFHFLLYGVPIIAVFALFRKPRSLRSSLLPLVAVAAGAWLAWDLAWQLQEELSASAWAIRKWGIFFF